MTVSNDPKPGLYFNRGYASCQKRACGNLGCSCRFKTGVRAHKTRGRGSKQVVALYEKAAVERLVVEQCLRGKIVRVRI